jgi:serine/threonine-protein kinase
VPSVVGLTEDEAKERLAADLLNPTVEPVASLEPEGIVVGQSVPPGATVTQGGFVTIFVSSGETPTGRVPDLIGMTIEDAVEALAAFEEESGVTVGWVQQKVATEDPDEVGRVLRTNPRPGARVEGTFQIVLTVGEGA